MLDQTTGKQAALQRALDLARRFGSEVEAFVCIYDQYVAGERFSDSRGLEWARESLKASAAKWARNQLELIDTSGVTLSLHVGWGSPPAETILERAREYAADLIVKEAHYHPRVERALFNNTDWNLLRGFHSALWLVKPGKWSDIPVIMAAVDPSQEHAKPAGLDARILDLAGSLADSMEGRLHVVHAYPRIRDSVLTITAIPGAAGYPLDIPGDTVEAEYRRGLEMLLVGRDQGPANVHFVAGEPRQVLLDLSETLGASLVVMGVADRGAIRRLVLGSTAEQVLDALSCDVLAVKMT